MTGLIQTRPEHGAEKTGEYAAYCRVSTDKQDNVNQEQVIRDYLNGGDHHVKWFSDECSSKTPWDHRTGLIDCIEYCRKTGATMIVYSLSRLGRTNWEVLRFFDKEVKRGHIKFVVVDNPILDEVNIQFSAMAADWERQKIQARTKDALKRIKTEIAEKGTYQTKSGKSITQLGRGDDLLDASKAGNEANRKKALQYAEMLETLFEGFVLGGLSYRAMADQLNKLGIATPSKRADPDMIKKPQWYASGARNYVQRLIHAGKIIR